MYTATRVLHVISGMAVADGHAAFCLQLAEQLAARGLAQRILALPTPGEPTHPDPRGLVQYVGGRQARLMNLILLLGLRRQWAKQIADFRPTVVHLHGGWHPFLYLCSRLARRDGIPVVLTLHGSLRPAVVEQDRRLKKRLAWYLYQRRLVAGANQIHVASEVEQSDLARLGFRQTVHVIPNGVAIKDVLLPEKSARAAGECRTVLYLGRLHPLKGLDLLLEAWAVMRLKSAQISGQGELGDINAEAQRLGGERENDAQRASHTHAHPPFRWRLVIAGPDEQGTLAGLERQARRLGLRLATRESEVSALTPVGTAMEGSGPYLDTTIFYAGPRYEEEKLRLLQEADLVVLPSRSENFGLVVAEALAAGVPVITTKAAPWGELKGETGKINAEAQRHGEEEGINAEGQRRGGAEAQQELPKARASSCGWWIEVGVEPLAAALREAMLLDDATRRDMGARGRRLIRERYGWEQVAERMVKVYGQVSGEWGVVSGRIG